MGRVMHDKGACEVGVCEKGHVKRAHEMRKHAAYEYALYGQDTSMRWGGQRRTMRRMGKRGTSM